MRRREFITLLGGAVAVWPLAARAHQSDRTRRVGVLMSFTENDSEGQTFVAAFREELQKLGWTDGRNIRIDTRWATPGDDGSGEKLAKEAAARTHSFTKYTHHHRAVAANSHHSNNIHGRF
jgi:putative ABC transport system substrate-binding protein